MHFCYTRSETDWHFDNSDTGTYVKVWHAWFFEVVPESSGHYVHRDIVGDYSTNAGQGWLTVEERRWKGTKR